MIRRLDTTDTSIHPLIRERVPALEAVCRAHGVERLVLIGSATRDDFDPQRSDVDFVVDFQPVTRHQPWAGEITTLQAALADVLGRPVDIVERRAVTKPHLAREIDATGIVIYGSTPAPLLSDLERQRLRDRDIMARKAEGFLNDLIQACRDLREFTENRTITDYEQDKLLRSAVERQFIVSGEAVRGLIDAQPDWEARLTNAREIIAFRNILVHGYFLTDNAKVWEVVTTHVPVLLDEALTLQSEAEG